VAWCGCRGALKGKGAVAAQVKLLQNVIRVMVHHEGTLVERDLPRMEGEERVLLVNTSHPDFTVPGANAAPAAPAASAPAKTATRQKRLSDGTSKPAGTSDDGARRQGTAARGRRPLWVRRVGPGNAEPDEEYEDEEDRAANAVFLAEPVIDNSAYVL
jgi:hypothetical protein